jgi:ribA/ribD-fused uncharacterized protein
VAAKRSPLVKSAALRLDQLYINNKRFTVNNIKEIPRDLHPENSSIIATADVVVFASKHAILSNLYPCDITIEGKTYNSTEQYIQYSKAVLFNDQIAAKNILDEADTFKIMKLGKKIRNFDRGTWQDRVFGVMKNANTFKFQQHDNARNALLATGTKKLGEATIDPYFGIGQTLNSKTVTSDSTWRGQNVMGTVLTSVRDSLA